MGKRPRLDFKWAEKEAKENRDTSSRVKCKSSFLSDGSIYEWAA